MNSVMITKNKTWLIVAVIGALSATWYLSAHKKLKTDTPNHAVIANPIITASISPSPFPSSINSPLSKSFLPATCKIQGSLDFITPNTAVNYGPKISYTGIDSPARQIKWKSIPADDLKVGPNLDAALKLPDGESPVNVVLPSSPVSKNYSLTASMTYGRLVNDGVRVYEVNCSGQIKATLSY